MQNLNLQTAVKPAKPRPDFPLFPHATGRWAKKINQKLHYFGKWTDDPQGVRAEAKYNREREDLEAGRKPTPDGAKGLTVADLCNKFLNSRRRRVEQGRITERSFGDYYRSCARIVACFGRTRLVDDLRPDDFDNLLAELGKTLGVTAIGNEIGRIKVVFGFGIKNRLVERLEYGTEFQRPDKSTVQRERAKRGSLMFEADELRKIIDAAGIPLKAMTLLGANCGLGQTDVGTLPESALDLDGGWLNFPRPKTGIPRRAKLWPETVKAIRAVLAARPKPVNPDDAALVFITKRGKRWVYHTRKGEEGNAENPERWINTDMVSKEFKKLLADLGINGHRGFYCLRRGFETIGGNSLDQVAVDSIMGHSRGDMASVYRQRIDDARLIKVSDVVRNWLFPRKRR